MGVSGGFLAVKFQRLRGIDEAWELNSLQYHVLCSSSSGVLRVERTSMIAVHVTVRVAIVTSILDLLLEEFDEWTMCTQTG